MSLNELLTNYLQYIILGLSGLIFIALIIFIDLNRRMVKLNRKYTKMMEGMDGSNIEAMLLKHIEEVHMVMQKTNELTEKHDQLAKTTNHCLQKVGIVRFNAFDDTGSDLSYAVALLDSYQNGVVISSIFGRSESRCYAKPIINAESTYFLTDEERKALKIAQEKFSN